MNYLFLPKSHQRLKSPAVRRWFWFSRLSLVLAAQALWWAASAQAQAAPSVSSIVRTSSSTVPASATDVSYTVTFSENVTGVDSGDFTLARAGTANGVIASTVGSDTTYTVTITSLSGDGTLRLDLNTSGTGIQNDNNVAIAGGYTGGAVYTLDHTGPAVSSVAVPASAVYIAGDVLDFTVNFNDSVNLDTSGGTPNLPLVIGNTARFANYSSGSGGSALVFRYTVVNGDADADGVAIASAIQPNGGTLRDAADNNAGVVLNNVASLSGVLVNAVAAAPAAPALISATAGDSQVTLSWTTPADNGSPITGYTVAGAPSGACTTAANTCTVVGLANGTTYSFSVTATNSGGASSASGTLSATPVRTQATGNVPGSAGLATAQISGGSATCTLASSNFNLAPPAGAPANSTRPAGVFGFRATGCAGNQLTVTLTYPDPLPSGIRFFKFGPPAAAQAAAWFELTGASVTLSNDRRTVSYAVTDNQAGDLDLALGTIEDPFAPMLLAAAAPASPSAIPTLSHAALGILSAMLALMAWRRRRTG